MNTILVVDDRPDGRDSMGRPLAKAGFDVRKTATGRDALRLAKLPADVIVLDVVLPDLDGYEVLRGLKADPATASIPVVLKSAILHDDGQWQLGLEPAPLPTSPHPSIRRRSSRSCAARSATARHSVLSPRLTAP